MPAFLQRAAAVVALMALSPAMAALAGLVRLTTSGPALHRAVRISRGRPFTLYKFRTMGPGAAGGPGITIAGDPRVTPFGRFLRRTKLDELPQLWNVARGQMLLVGPRPEDPRYVDWQNPIHQRVFAATPGITGPAAIAFRNEEDVLATEARSLALLDGRSTVTGSDIDRAYRERVLPSKLALDIEYLDRRSLRRDLDILRSTFRAVLRSGRE